MTRNTIPMAIAGLSTFIHVCMTFFTAYALIQLIVVVAEPYEGDDDGDSGLAIVGGFIITVLVISLLLEIAVLVVSVYLILGIKRERHQFIVPWVYLTGVYTILSFIGLIKGSYALDTTFAIKVIIIILHAAMWYPIFKYWRDLKTRRNTNIPENSPLNVCFTSQPDYYPPPGYGPQAPTAAGYYPPQDYAAEQLQPTTNPHLASASYPRQMMTKADEADNPPSGT